MDAGGGSGCFNFQASDFNFAPQAASASQLSQRQIAKPRSRLGAGKQRSAASSEAVPQWTPQPSAPQGQPQFSFGSSAPSGGSFNFSANTSTVSNPFTSFGSNSSNDATNNAGASSGFVFGAQNTNGMAGDASQSSRQSSPFGGFPQTTAQTTAGTAAPFSFGATNSIFAKDTAQSGTSDSGRASSPFNFGATTASEQTQPVSTPLFGQAPTTTTSIFGQNAPATNIFGNTSTSPLFPASQPPATGNMFAQNAQTATPFAAQNSFSESKPATTEAVFAATEAPTPGSTSLAQPTAAPSNIFSQSQGASRFGGSTQAPATPFGQKTGSNTFGQSTESSTPAFGQKAATPGNLFNQPASTPLFGATSTGNMFAQKETPNLFGQTKEASNVFSKKPDTASVEKTDSATSAFGEDAPTSLFGQKPDAPTQPLFGQNTDTTTQSLFGTAPATPAPTGATGSSSNLFGSKPAESLSIFGQKSATPISFTFGQSSQESKDGASTATLSQGSLFPASQPKSQEADADKTSQSESQPSEKSDSVPQSSTPSNLFAKPGTDFSSIFKPVAAKPSDTPNGFSQSSQTPTPEPTEQSLVPKAPTPQPASLEVPAKTKELQKSTVTGTLSIFDTEPELDSFYDWTSSMRAPRCSFPIDFLSDAQEAQILEKFPSKDWSEKEKRELIAAYLIRSYQDTTQDYLRKHPEVDEIPLLIRLTLRREGILRRYGLSQGSSAKRSRAIEDMELYLLGYEDARKRQRLDSAYKTVEPASTENLAKTAPTPAKLTNGNSTPKTTEPKPAPKAAPTPSKPANMFAAPTTPVEEKYGSATANAFKSILGTPKSTPDSTPKPADGGGKRKAEFQITKDGPEEQDDPKDGPTVGATDIKARKILKPRGRLSSMPSDSQSSTPAVSSPLKNVSTPSASIFDSPAAKTPSTNIFGHLSKAPVTVDDDDDEEPSPKKSKPGEDKSESAGKSLFDRISSDSPSEKGSPSANPFSNLTPKGSDNTWKPDSPLKFSATSPSVSIFGTPSNGTAAPSVSVFGSTPPKASPDPVFLGASTGGSSLAPSATTSKDTSRATSPGTGTSENESSGTDAEQQEQINLTSGGPGEENEEVLLSTRARAHKFVTTEGDDGEKTSVWVVKGVGFLRVLKHKETKATRILLRADPSGSIVLNKALLTGATYKAAGKTVNILAADDAGTGMESWLLQVKTPEGATELAKELEANKPAETVE